MDGSHHSLCATYRDQVQRRVIWQITSVQIQVELLDYFIPSSFLSYSMGRQTKNKKRASEKERRLPILEAEVPAKALLSDRATAIGEIDLAIADSIICHRECRWASRGAHFCTRKLNVQIGKMGVNLYPLLNPPSSLGSPCIVTSQKPRRKGCMR